MYTRTLTCTHACPWCLGTGQLLGQDHSFLLSPGVGRASWSPARSEVIRAITAAPQCPGQGPDFPPPPSIRLACAWERPAQPVSWERVQQRLPGMCALAPSLQASPLSAYRPRRGACPQPPLGLLLPARVSEGEPGLPPPQLSVPPASVFPL